MAAVDDEPPRLAVHRLIRSVRDFNAELAGVRPTPTVPAPPPPPARIDPTDPLSVFDALVTDEGLHSTTRALFADRHYARAVEEAYKYVNNAVKGRAGSALDGKALMFSVFDLDRPVLRFSRLRSDSERNEQEGYKFIMGGCMTGIRNPRAHEHDLRDEVDSAFEMILWANHLMRVLGRSTRTRARRAKATPAKVP